ncbi:MAG: DUF1800 domain-containing protein [Fimbriimonadaceae bacterium]|nr:DUF1800 domain-containing protein [Fimbriimonadaceae bacterium]
MEAREQIPHLLRRFGLGTTPEELSKYGSFTPTKALESMLDFERTKEDFPVTPWEFVVQPKGDVQFDSARFSRWWALRMVLTQTPAREKLTLFWHDHFAVSGEKVEFGPLMFGYLDILGKHGLGDYRTLLGKVSTCPAMLRWLDGDVSIKGQPNENFGRELLELFTLGIGNYTEKDVQEVARAFTGWSLRNLYRGGGNDAARRSQIRESFIYSRPLVASAYSPELNDDGVKTILGKTGRLDGDAVLDLLANHPQTARYICTKLWEYYAYANPEPTVVNRLVKVYTDSKRDIRAVLMAIGTSKEFWSDKCLRAQVKCPVDFTVAFVRQLGLREKILSYRKPSAGPMDPIPPEMQAISDLVLGAMRKQGMTLLYPPDVAGWDWGTNWVSPAMMIERMRLADLVSRTLRPQTATEIFATLSEQTSSDAVVAAFMARFDVSADDGKRAVLVEAMEKAGGPKAFKNANTATTALRSLVKLTFAMPDYQFC